MVEEQSPKFELINFSESEFEIIIEKSKELIRRGYFTGINFLQSDFPIPTSSIIIHYLHNSKRHLEGVKSCINTDYFIIPRYTYYMVKPEYFRKPNFKEEYNNAVFFDSEFKILSIDEAIENPDGITISNKELDLIIPLNEANILEEFLSIIKETGCKSPEPWIDSVIIVKTESPIKTIKNFVDKYFVSITREKEEFYTILTDKRRATALEKYFDKMCKKIRIGGLVRSDVVFFPSQVNKEFSDYLLKIQNQLRVLE